MKNQIVYLAILLILFGRMANAGQFEDAVAAYNKANFDQAFKLFQSIATQGHAAAQFHLGFMYELGEGVARDYKRAAYWYRKAAAQGNATAQFNLGFMYFLGQGVTQDYRQAAYWYRKAAAQGNAPAHYNLSLMYDLGQGVTQDYPEGAGWYKKAAAQGDAIAQYKLGAMYAQNRGVNITNTTMTAITGLPGDTVKSEKPCSPVYSDVPGGEDMKSNFDCGVQSDHPAAVAKNKAVKLEEYKVVLGADPLIKMPGIPGELRVWIGNPDFDPKLPKNMTVATSALPAVGETAKVTPFAPAFTIEPSRSECMKIDPTGSTVRFKLIPSKVGLFYVGADVQLFSSNNCGGAPIPKSTETLQVQVAVAGDEVTQKLGEIFWQKFLDFWGIAISLFFGLLLFLIRGRLKTWFSFGND